MLYMWLMKQLSASLKKLLRLTNETLLKVDFETIQ